MVGLPAVAPILAALAFLSATGPRFTFAVSSKEPIQGCPAATFGYDDDTDCKLKLEFTGSFPNWLKRENISQELLVVEQTLLHKFAVEQVCQCSPPALMGECPEDLVAGVARLVAACRGPGE